MNTRDHTTTVTLGGFMSNVSICKMVGWQARKEEMRFLLSVTFFNTKSEDIGFQQCHWSRFWLHNLFTIHVPCKSPRTRQREVLRQQTESHSVPCLLLLWKLGIKYNTLYGVSMDTILSQLYPLPPLNKLLISSSFCIATSPSMSSN